MAVSDVPSPSAPMAIKSPQVDASTSGALICAKAGARAGTDDAMLLQEWVARWADLMEFEIVPVVHAKRTREMVEGMLDATSGMPAAGEG